MRSSERDIVVEIIKARCRLLRLLRGLLRTGLGRSLVALGLLIVLLRRLLRALLTRLLRLL